MRRPIASQNMSEFEIFSLFNCSIFTFAYLSFLHSLYIQLAQDAPQNCGYSYDAYASSSPMASRVTVPKRAKPSARLISLEAELKQEPATSVVQLVVANTGPVIISDSDDSDWWTIVLQSSTFSHFFWSRLVMPAPCCVNHAHELQLIW